MLIPPQLKEYQFVPSSRGGPLIYSGGFVITSPIKHPKTGKKLALRLFTQLPDNMEQRYRIISQFVQQNLNSGLFVSVEYIEQGVKVNNEVFPICVMDWLEGDILRKYVAKNLSEPAKLARLADKFLTLIKKLQNINSAHGDLSHENIMVTNDEITLVDYDGMYVPDLEGYPPVVAGHISFQHPSRLRTPNYFGTYQDNFSAIAIYISLKAMSLDPGLYDRYENKSNSLLFKKEDFLNPQNSPFLAEIKNLNPEMADLARGFREICENDLLSVPSLQEFLRGKRNVSSAVLNRAVLPSNVLFSGTGNPVFDATTPDKERLKSAQGYTAVIGGPVYAVHQRTDQLMLEFSSGGIRTTFVVFIEGDAYRELQTTPQDYVRKWVKVTGIVEMNEINGEQVPCIITDSLQDISIQTRQEILVLLRTGNEALVSHAPKTPGDKSWLTRTSPVPTTSDTKPDTGDVNRLFQKDDKKDPFQGF